MLRYFANHPKGERNIGPRPAENRVCTRARPGPELHQLRADLGLARRLRFAIRHAPQQVARDAAIVAYSRVLDSLVERLIELDDDGYLSSDPAASGPMPR